MSAAGKSWGRVIGAATVASAGVLLLSTFAPVTAAPLSNGQGMASQAVALHDHALGSQITRVEGAVAPDSGSLVGSDGVSIAATVEGIDVSGHQGEVNWASYYNQGKRFVWVKATEGTTFRNPQFAQQYNGSYHTGFIRGSYHFARPNSSSGVAQANFFVDNGGGWSRDGKTLPGALDMEYQPSGPACYGLSKSAMAAWVRSFHDQYHARTGRWPVIYTSTSWWNQCVGSAETFGNTVPLWLARYNSTLGALPTGWNVHTAWQYSSTPIDQNRFNGGLDRVQALANG